MKLTLHPFDLPLRHVFTISRGSTNVSRTLVVELEQDGVRGFGEAGENTYYGATIAKMSASLEAVGGWLASYRLEEPTHLWHALSGQLAQDPFAQCALDLAAHDLWGKLRGEPVWKLWGLTLDNLPVTDYTLGLDTIESMVEKMREFPGWPVYKIKLGTPDDLAIVGALREETDAVFRVDANCAWGVEETIQNSAALAELGVEFIEQPLAPDDWEGMRRVFAESALPIVADESCQTEPDVARCGECFDGVNVKLVKCGGLTPARRMLTQAARLGLKTMVGCMTETSVGISAIAQLLPMLDYVDMDGALLLARDVAAGVTIDRGRIRFPDTSGCGVTLLERPL